MINITVTVYLVEIVKFRCCFVRVGSLGNVDFKMFL